ncbi:nucleoside-diphosphate-sugar epimerase [Paramyrothecium foliicola]|nr:nucleoside-diphosphate-sugar epimerase [Paramyrothecium foliicola]
MRVAVVPASTRSSLTTIRSLLSKAIPSSKSIEIRGWYRDPSKAPAEFTSQPNFEAVKGDVLDGASLNFEGCDVVVHVPPPFFGSPDMIPLTEALSRNVKEAIERAGSVQKLVLMSSQGAHLYEGVGEIKTKAVSERVLKETSVPHITIVRPVYFMENWAQQFALINSPETFMVSTLTPLDWKLGMVSLIDIGDALAKDAVTDEAQTTPVHIYELWGPDIKGYSANQVHAIFTRLFEKEIAIKGIESSELPDFLGKMLPPGALEEIVEMIRSFLPGGHLVENPDPLANIVQGSTKLETALENLVREAKKVEPPAA